MRTILPFVAAVLAFALGASIAWSADPPRAGKGFEGGTSEEGPGEAKKGPVAKGKVVFNAEVTYAGKTTKAITPQSAMTRLAGVQKLMERAAKGADAPMDFACKIQLNEDSQDFAEPGEAFAACQRIAAAMVNARKTGGDPAALTIPGPDEFGAPKVGGEGFRPQGEGRTPNGQPMGGFGGGVGGFGGGGVVGGGFGGGGVAGGGFGGGGNLPPVIQAEIQRRIARYQATLGGNPPNPEMIQKIIQGTIREAQAGGWKPGGDGPRPPMPGKEGAPKR